MVSKLRGNAVVSNKDSKPLFLCRTFDNRRYSFYTWEQTFAKPTVIWRSSVTSSPSVVLLALLILGRFHHLSLLAFPIFIFCFLFFEALDTFFILFTGILTFFLFFPVAVLHLSRPFLLKIIQPAAFSPTDEEHAMCGINFPTRHASESLDYSLSRNFLTSASLIAPTNCEIAVASRNAITVGKART